MKLNMSGVSKDAILDDAKVNQGIWLHLESSSLDPETGETFPLYLNGNPAYPQRALVRYHRCNAVKEAEQAQQKTAMVKMRVAPKKEKDKVVIENSLLKPDHRFSLILVAFENMGSEPGVQLVDAHDARELYGMAEYDSLVQQISDCSAEEAKYAATASTEVGNVSPPPPTSQTTAAETNAASQA